MLKSVTIVLQIRKAFEQKNILLLDSLLQNVSAIQYFQINDEIELIKKFVEVEKERSALVEEMKMAIEEKRRNKIMDILAQGKCMKIQWEPALFKKAMDTLKKQSEIMRCKEKAKQSKSLGLIQAAIEKAEENDPKDPEIEELKQLKTSIQEVIEECLVCLNILDKTLMEGVVKKSKALDVTNELIESVSLLLYEMDEKKFEELQFSIPSGINHK